MMDVISAVKAGMAMAIDVSSSFALNDGMSLLKLAMRAARSFPCAIPTEETRLVFRLLELWELLCSFGSSSERPTPVAARMSYVGSIAIALALSVSSK